MILGQRDSLASLVANCRFSRMNAALVFRDEDAMADFTGKITNSFLHGRCAELETVYSINDFSSGKNMHILPFVNGSTVFIYAAPEAEEIPHRQYVIAFEGDPLFDAKRCMEAAEKCGAADKISLHFADEEPDTDEIDAWLSSLKIID